MIVSKKELLVLLWLIPSCVFSQALNTNHFLEVDSIKQVRWLKKNAIQITSIDSSNEDFTDLRPLKKVIGNARVVMLGEQTHVDGSTYLAKTRMVKFLHQEMGFDVIAFESGFYDVARAWQHIGKGRSVHDAFRESVYFAEFKEYNPLIKYIQSNASSSHPLEMIGIDSDITGKTGRDSLVKDLRTFFHNIGLVTPHMDDTSAFAKGFISFMGQKNLDKSFFDTLANLTSIADSVTAVKNPTSKYFIQLLKSIKKAAECLTINTIKEKLSGEDRMRAAYLAVNIRDAQMADNLMWYVNSFYPNKKVIVWAANFHTAALDIAKTDKEFSQYLSAKQIQRDTSEIVNLKPMGQYIKEKMGNRAYIIAFTAYKGSFGIKWKDGNGYAVPIAVNQRPELEIEELLNAASFDYAFVDLRKPAKGGEWLKQTVVARPFGNAALKGEWYKAVDAFFYTKELFGVRE
jgi:erythromycin esterase